MNDLSELGVLSLGSQLKVLSDQLYSAADEVYRRHGLELQGRWFPVLRLLQDRGPMPIGEIARAVGLTHSAISQLAARLIRDGWVRATVDPSDRRTRTLALTDKADAALRAARPLWRGISDTLEARAKSMGLDVVGAVAQLRQIAGADLVEEVGKRVRSFREDAVRIVPFRSELRAHFYRLNAQWLERYFRLEPFDIEVLSKPEEMIVGRSGAIFFAMLEEDVVGTCALMQAGPGEYELTKMAVDPSAQGLGIGRKLIDAAIAEFERLGAKTLFLETNTKLETAIRLYERSGFEHQQALRPGSHYDRANVYMIWRGRPATQAA